jgi:hypothetical protein
MPFDNTDWIVMEEWHRQIRILAGELHDAFEQDDPGECLLKCDGLAAIASEVRAFVQRRAVERAERMSEPPDASWVSAFNAGQRS